MTSVCPAGHQSTGDDYCDVCGAPIDAAAQSQAVSSPAVSSPAVSPPSGGQSPADQPSSGVASAPQAPAAQAAAGATGVQVCPNCSTENVPEALFCEACGYDFTTGTLPRPSAPASDSGGTDGSADNAPESGTSAAGPDAASPSTPKPAFSFVAEVWIDPAWYEVQQSPDKLPSPGLPEIVPLTKTSVLIGRPSKSRNIHPDIDCETDSGASRRQSQLTTDGTRWWVEDLDSANGTFVGQASDPLPADPIPVGSKHELKPGDRIYVGAWTRIVIRAATDDELTSLT
jgi:hypothetical protein